MFILLSALVRFQRDDRGAFAVIFAIIAIVLVAFGGSVVDYVSLQQARNRAQIALDAAALALQPEIFDTALTSAQIRQRAQDLMINRIGDTSIVASVDEIKIDKDEGSLYLSGRITTPTIFVSLVGVKELGSLISSEAIRRKTQLEVAMVLDNSGSMDDYYNNLNQFRMTNLVNAAKKATEVLYAGASTTDPNVKISIVPFTQYVNIGSGNANQSWLNRAGSNPIMRDNFDNDANPTTQFNTILPIFDRISLFSQLKGSYSWGGCVEARQAPYDTQNTLPTTDATKFVPLFAPDEPDTNNSNPGSFNNSYLSDTGGVCSLATEPTCTATRVYSSYNSRTGVYSNMTSESYSFKSALGVTQNNLSACPVAYADWEQTGSVSGNTSTKTTTTNYISNRVRQERICKYVGGTVTKADPNYASGPNADCPAHAVVPLTYSQSTVLAAIEKMRPVGKTNQPKGGTNIAQGAVWGFHILSPGEPFTEAQNFSDTVKKVMILMTDGDNFHKPSDNMNGSTFFPAYGYPYNNTTRTNAGRLGQPGWTEDQLMTEMNNRTLATCTNAKAAGIEIFTIGLYSTTASTIQMLQDCASGSGNYYPATATNLTSVFESIARQLQPLRLNQ